MLRHSEYNLNTNKTYDPTEWSESQERGEKQHQISCADNIHKLHWLIAHHWIVYRWPSHKGFGVSKCPLWKFHMKIPYDAIFSNKIYIFIYIFIRQHRHVVKLTGSLLGCGCSSAGGCGGGFCCLYNCNKTLCSK